MVKISSDTCLQLYVATDSLETCRKFKTLSNKPPSNLSETLEELKKLLKAEQLHFPQKAD